MQWAVLFACSLLAVGFLLRAKVKLLQLFYVPAAVIGGLIGLACLYLLTTQVATIDAELAPQMDAAELSPQLQGEMAAVGIELSGETELQVRQLTKRWYLTDAGRSFVIVKAKKDSKLLEVHELHSPWNTKDLTDQLHKWPGWLISVIFAGLLLERSSKPFGKSMTLAARQGIVVWIIILGEIALGLAATGLIIQNSAAYAHVPGSFGQLIEAGFAGGHGTAAALGNVFEEMLGFADGFDLGMVFATLGLIYSVVSGIVFVNIAVRRGWTRRGDIKLSLISGMEDRTDPKPLGLARVRSEVIDPMVFQVLIVAAAFAIGIFIQWAFFAVVPLLLGLLQVSESGVEQTMKYMGNMPLFMFTLIGGLLVREIMHFLKIGDLIDPGSVRRIVAAAMEFLIVAAIASLKITVIIKFGWPVALLLLIGFVWAGFCLLFIGRRLLPRDYWFELGIINYGMSTGTTAQGMMLLRIVDKDLESGAAEDYALAAPLSAPFIGGGVITLLALPLLLQEVAVIWVAIGLFVVMALLYALGAWMAGSSDEA